MQAQTARWKRHMKAFSSQPVSRSAKHYQCRITLQTESTHSTLFRSSFHLPAMCLQYLSLSKNRMKLICGRWLTQSKWKLPDWMKRHFETYFLAGKEAESWSELDTASFFAANFTMNQNRRRQHREYEIQIFFGGLFFPALCVWSRMSLTRHGI